MEKPKPTPDTVLEVLPPPYSSLTSSQEYGLRPPVLATAPYPVTPESEYNQSIPMSVPPPYYYYNPMQTGTTATGIGIQPSIHNATFPPIYNPVVATPQERTHSRNFVSTICVMLLVVVIMAIMGIGISYYIDEVL